MKNILITGANSYIGTSFEKYMRKFEEYHIDTIDMVDENWRANDFSKYDTVIHVAGIAHSTPKASEKDLYYKVNTDLALQTAEHAKKNHVKQFIFMSSIIVYGSNASRITKDTIPQPDNFYGDSKLKADIGLQKFQSDDFNVVSIRPPMIYGQNSKGNYAKLAKLAKKLPVFPTVFNNRSMIYIENFCEFVRIIIDKDEHGIFFPQNEEYVNVFQLVETIRKANGKKLFGFSLLNPILRFLATKNCTFNKLFGDLVYEKELSNIGISYQKQSFVESIKLSEMGDTNVKL